VVAVLALVLAAGGVGYAAGTIGSAQIKDNSIQGKDVRNGTLQSKDVRDRSLRGVDLKPGSLGRSTDYTRCRTGEVFRFGTCIRQAPFGPSSYQAATSNCSDIGGRLPRLSELQFIAAHDETFGWADGMANQYEFSGDVTDGPGYTPIARDRGGNFFSDASASSFWYHCLTVR
jgi:hypothetical protein